LYCGTEAVSNNHEKFDFDMPFVITENVQEHIAGLEV
jgi:hypothetical protein